MSLRSAKRSGNPLLRAKRGNHYVFCIKGTTGRGGEWETGRRLTGISFEFISFIALY